MPRRKKSLLLIPPKGGRVQFFEVRFLVLAFWVLVFLAGIAGFFIPIGRFSLDAVEQNQRKNLTEQNSKLLHKIHGMRKLLHNLDEKMARIKSQRRTVEMMAGMEQSSPDAAGKLVPVDIRRLDKLLEYVISTEELYERFATTDSRGTGIFERIPALRPVAGEHVITAGFGDMDDPFTGGKKFHYGVDFAARRETPVVSSADGVIVSVENHQQWGRRVRIRHPYGFATVYAHLGSVSAVQGRRVKRGETIGTIGMTGITTGPHLHYEVWLMGKPANPQEYLFPDIEMAADGRPDGQS